MRKSIVISAACCIVVIGLLFFGAFSSSTTLPEPQISSTITSSSAVSSADTFFTIKEFNGTIAVFEQGIDSPVRVTDVAISSLPYVDQELLRVGIRANSRAELNRLLEDYCS